MRRLRKENNLMEIYSDLTDDWRLIISHEMLVNAHLSPHYLNNKFSRSMFILWLHACDEWWRKQMHLSTQSLTECVLALGSLRWVYLSRLWIRFIWTPSFIVFFSLFSFFNFCSFNSVLCLQNEHISRACAYANNRDATGLHLCDFFPLCVLLLLPLLTAAAAATAVVLCLLCCSSIIIVIKLLYRTHITLLNI